MAIVYYLRRIPDTTGALRPTGVIAAAVGCSAANEPTGALRPTGVIAAAVGCSAVRLLMKPLPLEQFKKRGRSTNESSSGQAVS